MTKRQSRARKRVLVAGRVRTGPKDGHLFVGVQNDPSSYDCLKGIECERGHADGDLFPGRSREWGDL